MASGHVNTVLRHVRQVTLGNTVTDAELLERFIARRDEVAFELLVKRHGPMVLGVCRRLLKNLHDAEDAFQATFLVLARKAPTIQPPALVANWLHGVAYRTALEARTLVARRRARERPLGDGPGPVVHEDHAGSELRQILDEELKGLPPNYRVAILLCDLEGKTHKQAARDLGWPQGTLSGRLARARVLLARRLKGRGVTLAGSPLVALLGQQSSVQVPTPLVVSTVQVSLLSTAAPVAGGWPAGAMVWMEGVAKAMLLNKLKVLAALSLMVGLLATATLRLVAWGHAAPAEQSHPAATGPAEKPIQANRGAQPTSPPTVKSKPVSLHQQVQSLEWELSKIDPEKRILSVRHMRHSADTLLWDRGEGDFALEKILWKGFAADGRLLLKDLEVSKEATIRIDGQKGTLGDLKKGMRLSLKLSEQAVVIGIEATTTARALFQAVNVERKILIARIHGKDTRIPLARNVQVIILGQAKAGWSDITPGSPLDLELKVEEGKIVVTRVKAQPPRQ
jgi:RNA polymerase sigma factor (sigma-70 family)